MVSKEANMSEDIIVVGMQRNDKRLDRIIKTCDRIHHNYEIMLEMGL